MRRSNSGTVYENPGRDSVHPFPTRMAPGLAVDLAAEREKSLRVLDPMSGSGTVLAVACSKGHLAIGVDIDPLAVLISRVWTTPVDTETLPSQAADVLRFARSLFASLRTQDAYPANSDADTRSFVRYWFDDYARRQLASFVAAIREVEDDPIRNALWCAFSRLIITKQSGASLAMDLSHSRPHRAFKRAPSKPFRNFLYAVDRVARNCIDSSDHSPGPPTRVHEGEARSLPLDDGSVDLVLTSPPYLNAIDYLRCSKFSLIWMGYSIGELRGLRSVAVGTEVGKNADDDIEIQNVLSKLNLQPKLRARQGAVLVRYIDDVRRVVGEPVRVLTDRGQAVFVVGENTVSGTFIPNSLIVNTLTDTAGLRCTTRCSRDLPANRRYLPPPSAQSKPVALNGRMRREVVLAFKKAARSHVSTSCRGVETVFGCCDKELPAPVNLPPLFKGTQPLVC